MKAVTFDAILSGIRTRSDNSLGLALATPELRPDEVMAFLELRNCNLKVLLQPVGEMPSELKEVKSQFDEKTPSHRLRSCIFVLWKHLTDAHKIEVSFDHFYRDTINRFCDNIKEQIPEQA